MKLTWKLPGELIRRVDFADFFISEQMFCKSNVTMYMSKYVMSLTFQEYIAKRDGVSLEEAAKRSLARAYELSQTGKVLGLITAFRGDYSIDVNRARNKALESDLRAAGFGFIPVLGGTTERVRDPKTGQETGETEKVHEEPFLFSAPETTENKQMYEIVLGLIRKYEQEAAIIKYKDGPEAFLITRDGKQENVGVWNQNRMAQFFTRMRYGADAENRRFSFECAEDRTISTQMAMKRLERI